MANPECDLETGICEPVAPVSPQTRVKELANGKELIYVGDPMCSWCWGIAPALRLLQQHCQHVGVPFRVVVGGLRPGGGDPWNRGFKEFLAGHWREIGKRTGQEFSYGILDREFFEYDTEPACRSVVVARSLRPGCELDFFAAVQHEFYVGNQDPKLREFYRGICSELNLDFDEFVRRFDSDEFSKLTRAEFQQSRSWGISGFPSILVQENGRRTTIACGYSTFEKMRIAMDALVLPPAGGSSDEPRQ